MPFNPTLPVDASLVEADELRNQFNALKSLIDVVVPIGAIIPWAKNTFSNMPALSALFVECNGQAISDPESVLNGQNAPDINPSQMFLRGAPVSGAYGGSATHTHDIEIGSGYDGVVLDNGGSGQALDANPKSTGQGSSLPPYYEVVYVMRVK